MAWRRSIGLTLLLVVAQIVPHISQESNHHCHQHSTPTTTKCLEVEQLALIQFKQGLSDPGHRLSSWTGDDCCSWSGITCSNLTTTGHVIRLNLRIPPRKHLGSDTMEEIDVSKALGGELHPSLLHLEHLQYLDLSYNDFQGLGIPKFIGSFKELKYLNLSTAGFSGIIPHHLGNLSTLQSLDLSKNMILMGQDPFLGLTIDNAYWLSGLISLKNLNLNFVSLIEASNWLHALNMLPSLHKIQLKGCIILSPFPSLQHVNFTSLTFLDLTSNSMGPSIPHWLFNLENLQYLYLGFNDFQGPIPASIGNSSSLRSLDLSYNFQLQLPTTIGNFCNTEPLAGLSAIDLYSQSAAKSRGCIKHSLRELFLASILIPVQIPDWIGDLKNLKVLDLSSNYINSTMPSWFSNLTAMSYLDLSSNDLHGSISPLIDNMISLEVLKLSGNSHLEAPTLMTLGNLCKLKILELSSVKITQKLNEFGGSFSGCIRNSLQVLNLLNTSLAGQLPTEIGNLRNLKFLNLAYNNLSGSIPKSFSQLLNLLSLNLESNNLDGVLDESFFTNLKHLSELYLSSNSLILNVSEDWIPPFQLQMISMGSCVVGPRFPAWIQTQDQLLSLNLSDSNISDVMPNWFWKLTKNIQILDLSHNKISGMMPPIPPKVQLFFLTDNLFFGEISLSSNSSYPDLMFLHLSMNNINGTIPPSLGNLSSLEILDISWNNLSGKLPDCWKQNPIVMVLDFSNNNIFGEIPGSICSSSYLSSLHLSKNNFSGMFPSSLRRCESLITLDIGHNKFYGHVPQWISKSMPKLKVLILKSNNFSGALPPELSALAQLHILDLSNNSFSGAIPKSYGDFNAMRLPNQMGLLLLDYNFYEENIQLIVKGNEQTYDKILRLLNAMDLSNNYLNGSIPEELANLIFLQSLNLSGNHFTGEITNMIGRMRALESLDLSRNNISGEIPSSLGNLDYLGRLNLSFNHLSWKIPSENHFGTFIDDESIYIGNYDLCGPPLTKNCPGEEQPPPTSDHHGQEDESNGLPDNVFFYLGIGSGFLVGLWAVFIIMLFKKTWRIAYFRCLDNTYDQIYVAVVVNYNRLRRKYEEQEH